MWLLYLDVVILRVLPSLSGESRILCLRLLFFPVMQWSAGKWSQMRAVVTKEAISRTFCRVQFKEKIVGWLPNDRLISKNTGGSIYRLTKF
mmetsp:Transcript_11941/g.27877  ORF Transcript_11941/g.27877 Transcript_11941/m.27877 type:complete len:91 (-) Transcript_11941:628-900(-)